ncbi:MAG: translation elongation factor Ts, elongation factor Ts [candidate division Kazan bacterium GW2011_GWA1_50_15]|uniref:Elongation factor Ts n=2 Tax=Bacteria division Kazan-3B-28 TaxID=1798534 RepID=A0A0G2A3W3_UNCK3|nr:MAG: translation elongation factor Ts, elongation factor Ts [candidate division Kazan bacterium GW2011_GWA1_50_15]KKW25599.1 MAG: Elongation factor Ts [candidate division Kazan bacterium GW2011_GWC1_52_13]KKW26904.1 MAG: Elongation factor Ts [candidate division Kazan bacterium GW2011_GWB1_52_7]HAV66104.1 translation elongation factor Ts [Patescibacteria group bacterium]HCR42692.1 translation elongation factor Ts [Patescibacteria group bacterium]
MEIKATDVKNLRDLTGAGMMEAKQALTEAAGDVARATAILKERGATIAAKKANRVAANGVVASYVHTGNKIGVLVEVNVETDFVARDEKFISFAREIAVHIAGMNPTYLTKDEVPADELAGADDKDAYIKEVCLLEQPFVKDPSKTIRQLVEEEVARFKENIQIKRFVRFELGVVPVC